MNQPHAGAVSPAREHSRDQAPDDSARGVLTMGAGTLVSRVLGFVRDAVFAALLGGGWVADAFLAAFRLPNFVRRLLAEGSLAYAFVPAYAVLRRGNDQPQGSTLPIRPEDVFARSVTAALVAVFSMAALAGLLLARPVAGIVAPGLEPEALDLAAHLLALCLPYLPLAAGAAGGAGVLLATRRFAPVAYAPAMLNVVLLATAAVAFALYGSASLDAARLLATGVVLAGAAQWLLIAIPLVRSGFSFRGPVVFMGEKDTATRTKVGETLRAMPGVAFAASSGQINILGATIIASFMAEGSISSLYFAERLLEFPLGIIGASIGLSTLADLSDSGQAARAGDHSEHARNQKESFAAKLEQSSRMALFLALPAAVGSMCLALPVTSLLFGHGAFSEQAVTATALAFMAYAPGLPALALARPLLAATTTLGNTRAGTRATLAGLGVTALFGLLLLPLGAAHGPALAVSLAAWTHTAILGRAVASQGIRSGIRRSWLARVLAACAAMAIAVLAMQSIVASALGRVIVGIPLGMAVYFLFCLVCRLPETASILAALADRRK